MLDFSSLFGIGITAFIASNIDDTFILMLLFSSLRFQTRHIIIGQFIGIGVLIIISALGALIALVLPPFFHYFNGSNSYSNRNQKTIGI